MSPSLSIHEVAEAEINEAADFYDLESPGLGGVPLDEIQRTFQRIVDFPDAAPLIRGCVRERIVTKFPYSLVYSTRGDEIGLLAVAYHKRRTFYWRGRR
jgi:toxin ParE1/3/4